MPHAILIIDDDATLSKNIQTYISRHGYDARVALSGREGLRELDAFKPDIVLLDWQLTDMNGLEVLKRIRGLDPHVKVIIMTGYGSVQTAVDAMKAGAYDYLSKPLVLGEIKILLDKAVGDERLEGILAYYQGMQVEQSGLSKLLGESPPMLALKDKVRRFIEAEHRMVEGEPPAVLITGETGTGKELVARAFHFEGTRKSRPFIEINCASIPAQIMEAELFGFERGAFTDAKERKLGLVETADGGTLFLDEIGELDITLQAKLLKLLEDRSVRRLGSLRDNRVDVRIVAATNRDLEERVHRREFRSDLYFRLRMIHVELPPLRARGDDVLLLAREFLKVHGMRYGKRDLHFTAGAEDALRSYSWPGNVRELRNVIEQAVLLMETDTIEAGHLALCPVLRGDKMVGGLAILPCQDLPQGGVNLEQLEVELVTQALKRTDWNVTHAAKLLGLSRDALRYRIEKYALRARS